MFARFIGSVGLLALLGVTAAFLSASVIPLVIVCFVVVVLSAIMSGKGRHP